jgi:hypothetical protein
VAVVYCGCKHLLKNNNKKKQDQEYIAYADAIAMAKKI